MLHLFCGVLLPHRWEHCQCRRCFASRNEGHEPDPANHCRCRYCNWQLPHAWDGCICSCCGHYRKFYAEEDRDDSQHQMLGGLCVRCKKAWKVEYPFRLLNAEDKYYDACSLYFLWRYYGDNPSDPTPRRFLESELQQMNEFVLGGSPYPGPCVPNAFRGKPYYSLRALHADVAQRTDSAERDQFLVHLERTMQRFHDAFESAAANVPPPLWTWSGDKLEVPLMAAVLAAHGENAVKPMLREVHRRLDAAADAARTLQGVGSFCMTCGNTGMIRNPRIPAAPRNSYHALHGTPGSMIPCPACRGR